MLYQIKDGTVSLSGETVLAHIDFEIKGKEKIAIVGKNGTGKTTLLRLIAGNLEVDRDDKRKEPAIWKSRNVTIGMLSQTTPFEQDRTVEEELLTFGNWDSLYDRERFLWEKEYDTLFTGFGFAKEDKKKFLSEFSGGERTKIALIGLLLQKPDILLLDEPTNHLDMETTQWLEEWLHSYEKAVVMVSHDRFFLDQVADIVYELSGHKLRKYSGNYTEYRRQKEKNLRLQKKAYDSQQEEIKRLNDLIKRFKNKPKKAAMARSKKKVLERMNLVEEPEKESGYRFTEAIVPEVPGSKWVLSAEHGLIGYESPLYNLELRIRRGQKIGVLGANGCGKTTLLKTICGEFPLLGGTMELGNDVEIGYFDQLTAEEVSDKTVLEGFMELFPSMLEKDARAMLARFLFSGKEAARKERELSGGERSRLALMKLLLRKPNFLVLDEPTNHMDITAKEMLESAFQMYGGTMLFVSHDRYFMDQVADALLVIEEGEVYYYPFGYRHYVERKNKGSMEASVRRSAEEQALIQGLAAVPLPEKRWVKEESADMQYAKWQFGLTEEALEQEIQRYEEIGKMQNVEMYFTETAFYEQYQEKLSKWEDHFTKVCLDWFEKWQQVEDERNRYKTENHEEISVSGEDQEAGSDS